LPSGIPLARTAFPFDGEKRTKNNNDADKDNGRKVLTAEYAEKTEKEIINGEDDKKRKKIMSLIKVKRPEGERYKM
jgi:hypothetical protein